MVSVSTRQSAVDQQISRLGHVIVGLQGNAQALHDAQLRQESTQSRLYNSMEAGFNASLNRLFMVERSATILQGALQEASQTIMQITSLSGVISNLWEWAFLTVILALVAFTVLSDHGDFAKYIAATISRSTCPYPFTMLINPEVTLVIVKCTLALLFGTAYGGYATSEYPSIERMTVFGFAIGILISIGWFYSKQMWPSIAKRSSPIETNMYHIGQTSSERKLHNTWRI